MKARDWKLELLVLLKRYPKTGLQHDIDAMTEAEQYAALAGLRRYANEQA